ncbi:MAG: hypothetical protein ACRDHP_07485, partial [Ktedonobacterales bacterium]
APPPLASPTVPYTNPDALPATADDAPAWLNAPVATALHGDPPDAPSGRMALPQGSNPGYGTVRADGLGRGTCVNGHAMPPGEIYCAMCGAPRVFSAPS